MVHPKLEYAAPSGVHIVKLRYSRWRRYRGRQPAGSARRWRNTGSVGEMLDELQWPTLGARRDQSSLLFSTRFIVGLCLLIKTITNLAPSQSTRSTSSSHISQYCRPHTYSDALKCFPPKTIHHWNRLAPSVIAAETTEEFRALIQMTQPEDFFIHSFFYTHLR